jgi:hypothetical protein
VIVADSVTHWIDGLRAGSEDSSQLLTHNASVK